jgi:hypothetical protein
LLVAIPSPKSRRETATGIALQLEEVHPETKGTLARETTERAARKKSPSCVAIGREDRAAKPLADEGVKSSR